MSTEMIETQTIKAFPCTKCSASFDKRAGLGQHMFRVHTAKGRAIAKRIGNNFAKKTAKNGKGHIEDLYCAKCDRDFDSPNSKWMHDFRVHTHRGRAVGKKAVAARLANNAARKEEAAEKPKIGRPKGAKNKPRQTSNGAAAFAAIPPDTHAPHEHSEDFNFCPGCGMNFEAARVAYRIALGRIRGE